MSNQLINHINTFYTSLNKMFITKHKKNNKKKYHIKDGIVNLVVSLDKDKIECNWCKNPKLCSLNKCKHVYFLLLNHFNLNIHQVCLLWREDNWEKFFTKDELPIDYSEEDCGICLEEIQINNKVQFHKLNQCLDCGNFTHLKCLQQIKKDHCIFCYKDNNPSFPL